MRKQTLIFLLFTLIALPLLAVGDLERWMERQDYTKAIFSVVVILLGVVIGAMALRYNYRNQYRGKKKFLAYAWSNHLVKLALVTLGAVLIITTVFKSPDMAVPSERIRVARMQKRSFLATHAYQQLLKTSPDSIALHVQYIMTTFAQDDWNPGGGGWQDPLADVHPRVTYNDLERDPSPRLQKIGTFGLAICDYYQGHTADAFESLMRMKREAFPYLNLFIGRCYSRFGEMEKAISYYEGELVMNGGAERLAVEHLAFEYRRLEDLSRLESLINDPEYGDYCPSVYARYLHTKEANLLPYFSTVLGEWVASINLIGLLGALGGLFVWFFFLRQVSVFRRNHWTSYAGIVLAGAIFTFASMPFYDFLDFELGFDLTGEMGHDFLYSIFGIGMVEEMVKIVPFLLVWRFTKAISSPLDFIVYASLSALGFAFIENLKYFDEGSISIMYSRILTASVFHMFATSTVAYGLVLARYRYKTVFNLSPVFTQILFFIGFFFLAAFLHGFYDFWLLNKAAGSFVFLTFILFIYATFQYAAYFNNCLNQSSLFRGHISLNTHRLAAQLLIGLMVVLLFEYVSMGVLYGGKQANHELLGSLGMGGFLMFFVVLNLTYIDVVQGEWFFLRFWNFGNRANYNKALGQHVELETARQGSILSNHLPLKGQIIARIRLQANNRYFLVRLSAPLEVSDRKLEYLIIKSKESGVVIEPGYGMEVAVIIFRDQQALLNQKKNRKDFKLLDYAVVK